MLNKDFLWGGALAAHQFEGGVLNTSKGYSVADVMTAGAHGVPRRITDQIMENESLVELLVRLTIEKAKKEGKQPQEILGEVKLLIEQKRTMERQRIIQAVTNAKSPN